MLGRAPGVIECVGKAQRRHAALGFPAAVGACSHEGGNIDIALECGIVYAVQLQVICARVQGETVRGSRHWFQFAPSVS